MPCYYYIYSVILCGIIFLALLIDPYEIMKTFIMDKTSDKAESAQRVCINYACNYAFPLKNFLTWLARKNHNKHIREKCKFNSIEYIISLKPI